jgi:hypothetical protein
LSKRTALQYFEAATEIKMAPRPVFAVRGGHIMAELTQLGEHEPLPPNATGNGSRPVSQEEKQGNRTQPDLVTIQVATGPRTKHGKRDRA